MGDTSFPLFEALKEPPNYPIALDQVRKNEFSRLVGSTYLDHAGATLYSESQLDSVFNLLRCSVWSNPHSKHIPGHSTTEAVESIRHLVLQYFNTDDQMYDLVYTSGSTSAIKLVAENFAWTEGRMEESGGVFLYTQENHSSILGIRALAHERGVKVYCLDSESLESCLRKRDEEFRLPAQDQTKMHGNENCLLAYPAQCNFSGYKYPLTWIEEIHKGNLNLENISYINYLPNREDSISSSNKKWFVLLDAASLVPTCRLDLSKYQPDFVPISFYKMFGYPTGLGCLLINKRAGRYLNKPYFGGGTVKMVESRSMDVELRDTLHERFEDGTLPYLDIISLKEGFNCLARISGGIENIEAHVYNLSRYLIYNLRSLSHGNNRPVVQIYLKIWELTKENHGSIVNFNLKDAQGRYIGFSQVERAASLYNIHLRTGCVCNPGACQKYLNITPDQLKTQFNAGHLCGDSNDLVKGMPTGSVRVSFGYMSTYEDADTVLKMIRECFADGNPLIDTDWYKPKELENLEIDRIGSIVSMICLEENLDIDKSHWISNFSKSGLNLDRGSNSSLEDGNGHLPCEHIQNPYLSTLDTPITKLHFYLTNIIIYPVKSCAGISVPSWRNGPRGLAYDREWMIVTSSGVTLTQKREPKLTLLKPRIIEEENVLILSRKGYGSVAVPLTKLHQNEIANENAILCGGRVCGDKVRGMDCGPHIAEWLSTALQIEGLRLIRQMEARTCKLASGNGKESLSLANESQYLVILKSSLRFLLQQMHKKQMCCKIDEEELIQRFRPNFVIEGGEAYEEDQWKAYTMGNIRFTVLDNCRRCQMVCVDPKSGERTKEPMLTLGSTRGPGMPFGIHSSYTQKKGCITTQITSSKENIEWDLRENMPVTVERNVM